MYGAACGASLSGRQRERPWHGEVDRSGVVLKKWRYEEMKSNVVKPSVSIREREGESSGKQRERAVHNNNNNNNGISE